MVLKTQPLPSLLYPLSWLSSEPLFLNSYLTHLTLVEEQIILQVKTFARQKVFLYPEMHAADPSILTSPWQCDLIQKANGKWWCAQGNTRLELSSIRNYSQSIQPVFLIPRGTSLPFSIAHVPFYPAVSLGGIDLKELKSESWRDTCSPMIIAAWFTISKLYKQPRSPSMDE